MNGAEKLEARGAARVGAIQSYYTPAEAADVLRISRDHVYELCRSGQLRSFKIGPRALRIDASAIADFVASCQAAS